MPGSVAEDSAAWLRGPARSLEDTVLDDLGRGERLRDCLGSAGTTLLEGSGSVLVQHRKEGRKGAQAKVVQLAGSALWPGRCSTQIRVSNPGGDPGTETSMHAPDCRVDEIKWGMLDACGHSYDPALPCQ